MDPPKPSAEGTSHESTGIDPDMDLPDSPRPPTNYEDPSYYTGYLDYVPSPPPPEFPYLDSCMDPSMDPWMDPYQPYYPVEQGATPMEDPNVVPSTFTYPQRSPDHNEWTTDPVGVYAPDHYRNILSSEEELIRIMAGDDTKLADELIERQREINKEDADRAYAELEAATADLDFLQPGYRADEDRARIDRDLAELFGTTAPRSANRAQSQLPSETLPSVEKASPQNRQAKRARQRAEAKKKSSTPARSTPARSTPARSITASTRSSASVQQRNASSPKTTTEIETQTPPPASASTRRTTSRKSKTKTETKTETTIPMSTSAQHTSAKTNTEPETELRMPAPATTRRTSLTNKAATDTKAETKTEDLPAKSTATRRRAAKKLADFEPSNPPSITNTQTETAAPKAQEPPLPTPASKQPVSGTKRPRGNKPPVSWEVASNADKMMSQMKQGDSATKWSEIGVAWNANRFDSDDEMTWRALTKRWGRIVDKIGPWPGFDVSTHLDPLR